MNHVRTFFGLLIMIFLAVPILFGIIWAVGLTHAVVSPKTYTELPGEIVAETSDLLDGMMRLARDDDSEMDYETRTWLNAVAASGSTPKQVSEEIGLNAWLEKEFSGSFAALADVMNGKSGARVVWLDMRPLKTAFSHPAMENWLARVLENLPACSAGESEAWARVLGNQDGCGSLPPCRPGETQGGAASALIRDRVTRNIPDRVDVMKHIDFPRGKTNIARTVTSFSYLLFLIPGIFIMLGALVGARSKSQFFSWSGASTMAGGGLVLALSSLAKEIVPSALCIGSLEHSSHWVSWHYAFADHAEGLIQVLHRHFIAPVNTVAGGVCIVGLLLFAFSFAFTRETEAPSRPLPQS